MIAVFREVRRVLLDDGSLWLNLGDSYSNSGKGDGGPSSKQLTNVGSRFTTPDTDSGLKSKNLVGIPWRVAFALQADGWYLRSDIIWAKPNPMPESVTDRPTKAHEYIFLLTKSQKYFYDAEAIKEPAISTSMRGPAGHPDTKSTNGNSGLCQREMDGIRNKRSVWTVATQPYSEAHFATFPPKLIEPCILAGTSEKGVCSICGSPIVRVVERKAMVKGPSKRKEALGDKGRTAASGHMVEPPSSKTIGWEPSCKHNGDTSPAIVLDPFMGAGTTALVAAKHSRNFVGCELNPEYAEIAHKRIKNEMAQGKFL